MSKQGVRVEPRGQAPIGILDAMTIFRLCGRTSAASPAGAGQVGGEKKDLGARN
jgi:hypothetical protein